MAGLLCFSRLPRAPHGSPWRVASAGLRARTGLVEPEAVDSSSLVEPEAVESGRFWRRDGLGWGAG